MLPSVITPIPPMRFPRAGGEGVVMMEEEEVDETDVVSLSVCLSVRVGCVALRTR